MAKSDISSINPDNASNQKETGSKKDCKINWQEYLSSENNINHLFTSIGIDEYEFVDIRTPHIINDHRYGIIVIVKEKEAGNLQEFVIDAISGEPSWAQLMDCTFNFGGDCEKRIILYALNHPDMKKGYLYEAEMATGFAHINNDCKVQTYIVRVSVDRDNQDDKSIIYGVEVKPDGAKRTNHTKLPTKHEFEQAEFGIYYNYTIDWDYGYINRPEDWISNYWHLEIAEIEFKYPVWNQDGLFTLAESVSELGVILIKWLFDTKMELFKKFFYNSDIRLQIKSPTSHVISIKLWDRPLSDFTKATTEDKERLAQMIRKQDSFLFEFWQEILDKGKSDNEIIDYFGSLPENAFTCLDTGKI